MFIKSTTTLTLLALRAISVSAQNATAQEINGVIANYEGAQLIPSFLPSLEPQGLLNVAFNGTEINLGDALTSETTAAFPNLQVSPITGSSAWGFGENYTYTALMADADIVGTAEGGEQTFHWLANGLTLGSSSTDPPFSFNLSTATTVINYAGPGPFAGTGPHRYVILLVPQYSNFIAPSGYTFGPHSTSEYLSTQGLGPVIATSYFTVENGEATVSVGSTTAVDSATLATVLGASTTAASSAASGSMSGSSMSGSMTGSMTRSATGTGAASGTVSSAAATSSGAAVGNVAGLTLGGNWVVVGVTMMGAVVGGLMI